MTLSLKFYLYHFVHAILSNAILSVYHFVRYHFVLEPQNGIGQNGIDKVATTF